MENTIGDRTAIRYRTIQNQTENDALLLGQSGGTQVPAALTNFTGTPRSWVRDLGIRAGNVSVCLPQGQCYFCAWSSATTLLDSLGLTQTQTQVAGSSFSPSLIIPSAFFVTIGVFFIVLVASILTRRVWRWKVPRDSSPVAGIAELHVLAPITKQHHG